MLESFIAHEVSKIFNCLKISLSKKWQLTVRSAYHHVLVWSSTILVTIVPLKNLWSLSVPPKVKIFTWRLLSNSQPVKSNLRSKGFLVDGICSLCRDDIESLDHHFCACSVVQRIWYYNSLHMVTLGGNHYCSYNVLKNTLSLGRLISQSCSSN